MRAKVEAPLYGFPQSLLDALDGMDPGPGPMSVCGMCGDTILGQRHRIIDAVTERLIAGDYDAGLDYGIPGHDLWILVAASYEHGKAFARQRRAERRAGLTDRREQEKR